MIALLAAILLPAAPAPQAPFPRIVTDAVSRYTVAPGIEYGEYLMRTADGPLAVHAIGVDLRNPHVRISSALALNTLVSSGETLSSMAHREDAIAGINADYFDINQTNEPLNLLIKNAYMIRPPMTHPVTRPALAFASDGSAEIAEFAVQEFAAISNRTVQLSTMNDWPPRGGAALLMTPDYVPLFPAPGVMLARLVPHGEVSPLGTYSIDALRDSTHLRPPATYLAFGPQFDRAALPATGDTVTISAQATPPIDGIRTAIGGGPLLVKDGAWYADPHGPSNGEFATHMPATAAGLTATGTLIMLEVDGRQPAVSIGVLQPQLASLLIAFGAHSALQFDGGGSSTMVARLPGDFQAQVVNSPSDGNERRIADALLISTDVKADSAPVHIVTRPRIIRAVPGARTTILAAEVNAWGLTTRAFPVTFAAKSVGTSVLRVARDGLHVNVPVVVTSTPSRLEIVPQQPAAQEHSALQLHVKAYDDAGFPIALPQTLAWQTTNGSVTPAGAFTAGSSDAIVRVRVGTTWTQTRVVVGEHQQTIPFADAQIAYDFTGAQRAAYANTNIALPPRALGLSLDVLGDGNGETLRTAVLNAVNERFLYTIARIDWTGWRHVEVRFPQELPQPLTLRSLYVVGRIGSTPPVVRAGSVMLKNVREIVAGRTATTAN